MLNNQYNYENASDIVYEKLFYQTEYTHVLGTPNTTKKL